MVLISNIIGILLFQNLKDSLRWIVLAIYKENKLLKTLNDLGFQDLSRNLENIFIPMRGSTVSEIEMTNEVWRKIKKKLRLQIFSQIPSSAAPKVEGE